MNLTLSEQYRKNGTSPPWSARDIARLKKGYAAGRSYSQIGKIVGRSREAVAGKLARLGLFLKPREKRRRLGRGHCRLVELQS